MAKVYLVIKQVEDWDSEVIAVYLKKTLAVKKMKQIAREKLKEEKQYMSINAYKAAVFEDGQINFTSDDVHYGFRVDEYELETN